MKAFRRISPHVPLHEQVEEYLSWCMTRQSQTTIKAKRWHYARLYQDTGLNDLRQLTNAILNNWLNEMAQGGAGPVALNRAITSIKALVNWHREMNDMAIPVKLLLLKRMPEVRPEQVFYRRETIERVARHTKKEDAKLMIEIAFDTGIRASELARLKVAQIRGQRLDFLAKGGIRRTTFVTRKTARHIERYVATKGLTEFLFPGNHEGHIAYNTLRKKMANAFSEQNIGDFHPHALRHSFVADLERRGASVEELQVLVGHSNIKSTQIYQHRIKQVSYLQNLHKRFKKW